MSHEYVARIVNYISQCRMMSESSVKRIRDILDACRDNERGASSVIDADMRKTIDRLYSECEDTIRRIETYTNGLGGNATESDLRNISRMSSSINSLYLQLNAINTSITSAAVFGPAKSGTDAFDYDSVGDPEIRSMMKLLAKNKSHRNLSFDELRGLAESKLDPSKKVSKGFYVESRNEIKRALEIDDGGPEMIPEPEEEEFSPLELMDRSFQNAVDESLRKSAVKAIVASIRGKGFIVEKKNIRRKGDIVTIVALKPGNQRAEFSIDLNGKFTYRFDGYEGKACEKDISAMEDDLEKVYGIKVTDKKVIWSNPDKLTKTQMMGRREGRV